MGSQHGRALGQTIGALLVALALSMGCEGDPETASADAAAGLPAGDAVGTAEVAAPVQDVVHITEGDSGPVAASDAGREEDAPLVEDAPAAEDVPPYEDTPAAEDVPLGEDTLAAEDVPPNEDASPTADTDSQPDGETPPDGHVIVYLGYQGNLPLQDVRVGIAGAEDVLCADIVPPAFPAATYREITVPGFAGTAELHDIPAGREYTVFALANGPRGGPVAAGCADAVAVTAGATSRCKT